MHYEYVYLLRQDLSSTQLEDIGNKVKEIAETFGGNISKVESWGLRNLAYKIKKNKKAHYFLTNLTVSPEGLKEIQRVMSVNDNVLRDLAIKVETLDASQSPMVMKSTYKIDTSEQNLPRKNTPEQETLEGESVDKA